MCKSVIKSYEFVCSACLRRPLRICSSSLPPPQRPLDRAICPKGPKATERGWSREGRKGETGTKCELMDGRTTASIPSAQHTTCVQCSAVRGVHGISTPSHSSQLQSDLLTVSLTTYTTSSVPANFHSRRRQQKLQRIFGSVTFCFIVKSRQIFKLLFLLLHYTYVFLILF